jgi:hypothetical protein
MQCSSTRTARSSTQAAVERARTWAVEYGFATAEVLAVAHGNRTPRTVRLVRPDLDDAVDAAAAASRACSTTTSTTAALRGLDGLAPRRPE